MNCGNCNTPLIPGNNVCPTCGALNMPLNQIPQMMQNVNQMPQANVEQVQSSSIQEVQSPVMDANVMQVSQNAENIQTEELEDNGFTELDDEENKVQITADMAPPTLDVQSENLTAGVVDISNANISTYSPEEEVVEKEVDHEIQELAQNRIDITIPSVSAPIEVDKLNLDENGVPILENSGEIKPSIDSVPVNEGTNKPSLRVGKFDIKVPVMKNGKPINMTLVAIVVCFVIGVLVGKTFFSKSVYVPNSFNQNKTDEIVRVSDGKNNITKAGAYTFTIPDKYYYDTNSGGVSVYDDKDTFRLFIRAVSGSYVDLATAKTSITETLKEQGVSIASYKETSIDKKDYVVIETSIKMNNKLMAFTDAEHDYVFFIEIVSADDTYNYDVLDLANDIVKNVKYNEKSSEMEKVKINDISEIIIRASQEYKKLTK